MTTDRKRLRWASVRLTYGALLFAAQLGSASHGEETELPNIQKPASDVRSNTRQILPPSALFSRPPVGSLPPSYAAPLLRSAGRINGIRELARWAREGAPTRPQSRDLSHPDRTSGSAEADAESHATAAVLQFKPLGRVARTKVVEYRDMPIEEAIYFGLKNNSAKLNYRLQRPSQDGRNGTPHHFLADITPIDPQADISELSLRVSSLVNEVEHAYWVLYASYRDVDARISGRDASLEKWRILNSLRDQLGADEEALARAEYHKWQLAVLNSTGRLSAAERQLRRAVGLPITAGRFLRPTNEPLMAEVVFKWDELLDYAAQSIGVQKDELTQPVIHDLSDAVANCQLAYEQVGLQIERLTAAKQGQQALLARARGDLRTQTRSLDLIAFAHSEVVGARAGFYQGLADYMRYVGDVCYSARASLDRYGIRVTKTDPRK
jgi:hypothetical protein